MREGATLARQRLLEGREPANKVSLDKGRLRLVQAAAADAAELRFEWQDFARQLDLGPPAEPLALHSRARRWLSRSLVAVPLLALLALLSAFEVGRPSQEAFLRLSWRLPGQAVRQCRDLSEAELATRPSHMRRKQECSSRRLSYRLEVAVDGQVLLSSTVAPRGAHGDSPLNVNEELKIQTGEHRVRLSFEPLDDPQQQGRRLVFDDVWQAESGRAVLVTLDQDGKALIKLLKAR